MAATDAPPSASPPDGELARPRRSVQISLVVAAVLLGLGIVFAVPPLRHAFELCLRGDFSGLRSYIKGLGAGGLALLVGLMLMHALIYYPTELVTATTAFVYGWLPGLANRDGRVAAVGAALLPARTAARRAAAALAAGDAL
jgi:hypothetical protein